MYIHPAALLVAIVSALVLLVSACGDDEKADCDAADTDTGACPVRSCPDAGSTTSSGYENDIGTVCGYDEDCSEHCVRGLSGMAPYCTRSCSDTAPCPAGFSCLSWGQLGMACIMGNCASDADCPVNYACNMDDTDNQICLHKDIPCIKADDCPAGTACIREVCKLLCESDEDCKVQYYCHWHTRCVRCTSNAHCEDGYSCEDGNCNKSCIENRDCRQGYECAAGVCNKITGGGSVEFGEVDGGCEGDTPCTDFCQSNGNYCTKTCEGETDTTTCPEGYSCHSGDLYCHRD